MNRMLFGALVAASLLTACVVGPPGLPVVVELGAEPYYQHGGYFYYYNDSRWSYSRDRAGPWRELPRDRYPREVRHRGQDYHDGDRKRDDDHDRDRDYRY